MDRCDWKTNTGELAEIKTNKPTNQQTGEKKEGDCMKRREKKKDQHINNEVEGLC